VPSSPPRMAISASGPTKEWPRDRRTQRSECPAAHLSVPQSRTCMRSLGDRDTTTTDGVLDTEDLSSRAPLDALTRARR
jgi:hypothetical protein